MVGWVTKMQLPSDKLVFRMQEVVGLVGEGSCEEAGTQ